MTKNSVFNAASIIDAAVNETGLDDFGPVPVQEPLQRFIDSILTQDWKAENAAGLRVDIVNQMCNRLRLVGKLKAHPEIHQQDVLDPIMIMGLPRTGATKLFNVIAADTGMNSAPFWRLLNPVAIPGVPRGQPEPRLAYAEAAAEASYKEGHAITANGIEEDIWAIRHCCQYVGNTIWGCDDAFAQWALTQSQLPCYEYFRSILRYWQWEDAEPQRRPWVLKSPANLGNLKEMAEVFRNAAFIYLERDLPTVIASFCKLYEGNQAPAVHGLDRNRIGDFALRYWPREYARFHKAKKTLGDRIKLLEVSYEAVKDHPLQVIQDLYALGGRTLSPALEQNLRKWAQANPQGKHGKHHYALEDYGINKEQVYDAFSQQKKPRASC